MKQLHQGWATSTMQWYQVYQGKHMCLFNEWGPCCSLRCYISNISLLARNINWHGYCSIKIDVYVKGIRPTTSCNLSIQTLESKLKGNDEASIKTLGLMNSGGIKVINRQARYWSSASAHLMQLSTWLVEAAGLDGYPSNLRHKSWTNSTPVVILHS